MNINKSCAITGHRPERLPWKNDELDYGCLELKQKLYDMAERFIKMGVDTFYTGMAKGVDIIFGEIIIYLRQEYPHIRLIGVIAYEEQAARWNLHYRERFFELASKCDDVVTINTKYHKDCYRQRNEYLVNHANHLIAVYDCGHKRSGTRQTIDMAKKLSRDIVIINSKCIDMRIFDYTLKHFKRLK